MTEPDVAVFLLLIEGEASENVTIKMFFFQIFSQRVAGAPGCAPPGS
jgi:hypothetical protein